jgi:hypothetical protein
MSDEIFEAVKSKANPLIEEIRQCEDVHELHELHDQLVAFVEDIQCQIASKENKLILQQHSDGHAGRVQEFDSWKALAMRYRQKALARQRECKTRIRKLEAESRVSLRQQVDDLAERIDDLETMVNVLSTKGSA